MISSSKSVLRVLSLLLFITSLTQCDQPVVEVKKTSPPNLFAVTVDQATSIGTTFHVITNEIDTSSYSRKNSSIGRISAENLVAETITTVEDNGEPAFYIINYKGKSGWTIVSADRRVSPVLAYSNEGFFDLENTPGGVSDWITMIKKQVKTAKLTLTEADPSIERLWKKYDKDTKSARISGGCYTGTCNTYITPCQSPYLTTTGAMLTDASGQELQWGQGAGYNHYSPSRTKQACFFFCDKAAVGCGPVALAMVMRFYSRPTGYNYAAMPRSVTATCGGNLTAGENDVARLMKACGNWSNTDYYLATGCSTYTWSGNLDEAFAAAGYSQRGDLINFYDNLTRVKNELMARRPIILVGSTCNTCAGDAHEWVLDGYQESHYFDLDCCNGYPLCTESGYTYYHLNWGWDGNSNGWFGLHNFIGNGQNYDHWMRAQIGMRP